jgi:DNA-binding NarL/FixJ family response regulator
VRVVVADDSVLLREGLVRLLTEVDTEVVAAVDDAPSFLQPSVSIGPTSRLWMYGCHPA